MYIVMYVQTFSLLPTLRPLIIIQYKNNASFGGKYCVILLKIAINHSPVNIIIKVSAVN